MRILKWSLLILVVLVLLMAAAGAAYQSWATSRDETRFPMPGERVDIGGRSLHLYCSGEGPETVLLENGLTGSYVMWRDVQQRISRFTRVCSYDRAGLGFSDPSPNPTRAKFVVDDLHQLVRAAAIHGPLILVGWSAGGVYVRRYYHEHPDGVVAMVLVESSHEQQDQRLPEPDDGSFEDQSRRMLNICQALSWSGLVRAMGVFEELAKAQHVPASVIPEYVALANRTEYCSGISREIAGFPADTRSASPPASLGDLPLVVLTRGKPSAADDFPMPVSEDRLHQMDAAWNALQKELAGLSTRSVRRVVPGSGHAIPLEAPAAVVAAVRDVSSANP